MNKSFLHAALVAVALACPIGASAMSPDEEARQRAEMKQMYQRLDAQAVSRSGKRLWSPSFDLAAAASQASPGAKVGPAQCGVAVCRIELDHRSAATLDAFPRLLADAGAAPAGIVMEYHHGQPLRMTAYVLMPEPHADERRRALLPAPRPLLSSLSD